MSSTALTKMDQLRSAYTAGDDKKAEKIALALLKQKTSAPTAAYALGLIKHDQTDYPAAIAYFEQALLLDRQQERTGITYYWIGRSYEDSASGQNPREYQDKRDKAREAYEKATECSSYPVEVIRRLALLHPFGYPRLKWYLVGIAQFPQEFPFYIYSSWIYRKENQPLRQLEVLQEGLGKNPGSTSLLFQIAQYHHTHQRFDDSLAAIQLAIDKNGGNYSLDSLHYFAGSIQLIKGNWDKAILHFEFSILACANSNGIWYGICGLVAAYQKKRQLPEVRKYIDAIILDRSIFEHVDFRYGLLSNLEGEILGETGLLQAESDIVPFLKQLHEESNDTLFKTKTAIVLSALCEYFDRHEDRFTYVRYALKHSEEVSYLQASLSDTYQELAASRTSSTKLVEQLHEDLETCLTEDRASAIVSTLVEKLFAETKYAETVQLCSPLDQDYLKKSRKEFEYAYALSETGDKAAAKTQYEYYLKANPTSSAARNNLAIILRDKEQFDPAIALFNEAINLDPSKDLYKTIYKRRSNCRRKNAGTKRRRKFQRTGQAPPPCSPWKNWRRRIILIYLTESSVSTANSVRCCNGIGKNWSSITGCRIINQPSFYPVPLLSCS